MEEIYGKNVEKIENIFSKNFDFFQIVFRRFLRYQVQIAHIKFEDHWSSGSGDIRADRQADKFSKFSIFKSFFDDFFRDFFQNSDQAIFFRQIAALSVNVNKVQILRQIQTMFLHCQYVSFLPQVIHACHLHTYCNGS